MVEFTEETLFKPISTESQILAFRAQLEFESLPVEEQEQIKVRWEALSEFEREEIRAAVEFDLL